LKVAPISTVVPAGTNTVVLAPGRLPSTAEEVVCGSLLVTTCLKKAAPEVKVLMVACEAAAANASDATARACWVGRLNARAVSLKLRSVRLRDICGSFSRAVEGAPCAGQQGVRQSGVSARGHALDRT